MKGAVFIALNELIESQHGIDTWELLLAKVKPQCSGIYISTEDYPDADIQKFVLEISALLNVPSTDVTKLFGHYLFSELNNKFPMFSKASKDLFSFLNSIEDVIHKEVRKLYENPSLPKLDCKYISNDTLEIEYRSPRKLCYLAEGLILGASEFYHTKITLDHTGCMHEGKDHCTLLVKKYHD